MTTPAFISINFGDEVELTDGTHGAAIGMNPEGEYLLLTDDDQMIVAPADEINAVISLSDK